MNTLKTKEIKRYYFVKNGVVFDIKSSNPKNDQCAFLASGVTITENKDGEGKVTGYSFDESTANVPYIKVVNDDLPDSAETKTQFYYLDCFIKDGDAYQNGEFKKTIHNESEEEETMTMDKYYEGIVNDEVVNVIKRYFEYDYDELSENLISFGIPAYTLKDSGYTVSGFEQIHFTEDYVDYAKHKIVFDEVMNASNKVLKYFKYKFKDGVSDQIDNGIEPDSEG